MGVGGGGGGEGGGGRVDEQTDEQAITMNKCTSYGQGKLNF